MKSILKPTKFKYKGDEKRPAQGPIAKHPGIAALAISLERGKGKTNYTCLMKMLANANWAHDMYWELGCYDIAIRYTKIAQRILMAMTNKDNGLVGNYLRTGL